MKKTIILIFILIFIGVFAAVMLALDVSRYATRPISVDELEKEVIVSPSQAFDDILSSMVKSGLNISPFRFKIIARVKGYDKKIKAGEYVLRSNMSPKEIFEALVSGKERLYRITIPEGYTVAQIADLVKETGWDIKEEFIRLSENEDFVKQLGIPASTLEGYLFPDTYFFPKKINAEKMIVIMVDHFKTIFSIQWRQRADEMGWSVHQVVTMASIIEKETGAADERPIISSVFHNRLKRGMRLESDPTVIYGIKNFDGNITRKHLATSTPYNTYKIKDLPPGPIANPGKASIEAALYPAETDYLFFVSKKDQTHHFSTNMEAHAQAVRKYQLRRK